LIRKQPSDINTGEGGLKMKVIENSQIVRTISLLIAVCLISIPTQAKYGGGSGTADDPYQIATAADLLLLGDSPEDYDKHFILTADIDLDPNLPGRTVFDKAVIARFTSVFDGNGHTISHLTIRGGGYLGLFGELRSGAEVRDLGVADVNITASDDYTGGLVGTNGGALTGCHSTGVVSGREDVGGLVGDNWGPVAQCYSACAVSGGNGVGGLMGENSNGTVNNCYSTGPVRGTGWDGGLMAYNGGTVIHCFWDIQTSGQATSAGGTGKTTAEMQTATTFLDAGWDFVGETANGSDDIWKISEGIDYPRLWWEKYGGGSGTADDPYQIGSAADLIALGDSPQDYDKHFILTADIDLDPNLPGRKVFDKAVIGSDANAVEDYFQGTPFSGVFDGNGHTISHLTLKGGSYMALFGRNWLGTVTNLGLVDVNITGSSIVGGLVGQNYGDVTQCYTTGVVGGSTDVGGVVGHNDGAVTDCYSTAAVSGTDNVGGVVGSNSSDVTHCYGTGAVSGRGAVGGLVGYNHYATVTQCYSAGAVSGQYDVGGLVGDNAGSLVRCYSTGLVSGNRHVGGLVGSNTGALTHCYSTGAVSGFTYVGGFVGRNWQGTVTGCFWDTQTSGQATSAGGTGKTTSEMQTAATFLDAGWDFVGEMENGTQNIWAICEGLDYPKLAWQFVIGDFNGDNQADFMDFCIFGQRWLGTDSSFWCASGTDLTNDGLVDVADLQEFAENWLAGIAR
jgi:hypothetical protein